MTSNAGGGGRILGTLGQADGRGVVRIEDRFDAGIDDVWSAITDPTRVARWYGVVEGDLRPGGDFRLNVESSGWEGTGHVETCEPPRHLRVTTRESDESYLAGGGLPPFEQSVDATLTQDGGQTVVVIEVRGMPLDKVPFYGVGWQIHAESLACHLAGRERGDDETRWGQLIAPYQDLASRIG
jgi:uncharacterized protein YndB with AHSA1/START domain